MMTNPDDIALWFNGDSVSCQQLEKKLGQLIQQLNPVLNQPVIAYVSDDAWLCYLLVHACSRIKKPLFLLNPELPEQRLQWLLRQSSCEFVITGRKSLNLPDEISLLGVDTLFSMPHGNKKKPISKNDTAGIQLIVATSGSGNEPKAVMLSAAAISASANAVNRVLGFQAQDCWLNCLPLYHIAGLSIINRCVNAGACMVLHLNFNAMKVWKDLHDHAITHISLVPAMLSRLLDVSSDARPPATLHVALIGGASLSPSLARRAHNAGWPIVISYGMTETGSMCAYDASPDAGLIAGRVGQILDGFEITLTSNHGNIVVAGSGMMLGYANPEMLAGVGLLDGRLTTGDVGRLDEQGVLYVSGRSDEVLVTGGLTIHPREIEVQLEAYDGVDYVAVTSLPDPVWGDSLVAVYAACDIDAGDFESWARKQLASAIRPRTFIKLAELPVNRMGKLDRKKLREIIQQQDI
ncbi:MAG: AMP-binding protein [Pseudomonadota bacterium]|nr:AMP-binding protein [Pseudomonadota bacterium]